MTIVFSADRGILAALHVAAQSVLAHFQGKPRFVILTDELDGADISQLAATLDVTGKEYSLEFKRIDGKSLRGFPKLAGGHSTYFRLLIPDLIPEERCLYLDADVICFCDLSGAFSVDLDGNPGALVPEAPIELCTDQKVFEMLGSKARGHYYNAGVFLMDCERWRSEDLKTACFEFIGDHQPDYHDQSALNYVLHGRISQLPSHYNRMSNVRSNWPLFRPPQSCRGQLVHFVDFPKPWSLFGRRVHPLGQLWWESYQRTAHASSGAAKPRSLEWSARAKVGYKKALKDKLLFSLYCRGKFLPKHVPPDHT